MNTDETEDLRRALIALTNIAASTMTVPDFREQLEREYGPGNCWSTEELREQFTVEGFLAPFAVVVRKADGVKGCVTFSHSPRFYFDFVRD